MENKLVGKQWQKGKVTQSVSFPTSKSLGSPPCLETDTILDRLCDCPAVVGPAVIAVVGLIAILAGAAIVDLLMPLPSSVRIALLIGVIGAVGYLLYRYLIQPIRVKLTPHDVALNVERKHQDLEDRLVSALQFGEVETEDPIKSHLLQRLVTDAVERTEGIDFKATVDKSNKRKQIGIAVAALAGCALIGLIFPTELNTSLNRLLSPWEKTEPVFTTKLAVEPGERPHSTGSKPCD